MISLDDWKAIGSFSNYKGQKIFNIDQGTGEVLLLIHGFPTSSSDWRLMWDELVKRYRVICLDMLGFGFSDKPKKYRYSIKDQADIIEELLLSKNVTKIKILCHDYGDTVTQELLARQKEQDKAISKNIQIESVCFLNGGLFPEVHRPLLIQKLLMLPVGSIIFRFFNRKKLAKNLRHIFGPETQASEHLIDEFWELMTYNGGKKVFHLLIRYMQERIDNRERWVGALCSSQIPMRFINGTYDPISGKNMVVRYVELVPNPDVIELNNIGHFPLLEAPERVLQHYFSFISSYS